MHRNLIKISFVAFIALFFCFLAVFFFVKPALKNNFPSEAKRMNIEPLISDHDQDKDGLDDFSDIVASARSQIGVVTQYDTNYYAEAFPPPEKGACADVIWRALKGAGYDFKTRIDEDMEKFPEKYKTEPLPDRNINFRRVENIRVFLSKHALSLPTEIIPDDKASVSQWQGGDIVTFAQIPGGLWHVAIVSDKRREDGVPFLIHNYGMGVKETDYLLTWPTRITGHFRFDGSRLAL